MIPIKSVLEDGDDGVDGIPAAGSLTISVKNERCFKVRISITRLATLRQFAATNIEQETKVFPAKSKN